MRHLIIGAGNLGKRYADILKQLGQEIDLVDLEFDTRTYNKAHDSALICTPSETHSNLIGWLPWDLPVFCEKPLTIDGFIPRKPRNITLVSANWIWCPHLPKPENLLIENSYPSKSKYWQWDLIHYWSYFVHEHGEPTGFAGGIYDKKEAWITLDTAAAAMTATIINTENSTCLVNDKIIHSRPCFMHHEQMKHWLAVLRGAESVNPIEKSLRHHIALGKLLARPLSPNVGTGRGS